MPSEPIDPSKVIIDDEPIDAARVIVDEPELFTPSKAAWGRLRAGFAGDPLAVFGDDYSRSTVALAAERMPDSETELKRYALAAYYCQNNKKAFGFVLNNLDSMIERYHGKAINVDAAYQDIAQILNPPAPGTSGGVWEAAKSGTAGVMKTLTNLGMTVLEGNAMTVARGRKSRDAIESGAKELRSEVVGYWSDVQQANYEKVLPADWVTNSKGVADWGRNAVYAVLMEAPQMAVQTGMLMANPMLGMAYAGISSGNDKQFDLEESNPEMSGVARVGNAITTGIINGTLERVTLGILKAKGLKLEPETLKAGFREGINYYLRSFGKEGATEGVEQLAENAVDLMTGVYGRDLPVEEQLKILGRGVPECLVIGGIYGDAFAGIGHRNLRQMDLARHEGVRRLEARLETLRAAENPSDLEIAEIRRIETTLDSGNLNAILGSAELLKLDEAERNAAQEQQQAEREAEMTSEDRRDVAESELRDRYQMRHNPEDTADAARAMMAQFPGLKLELVNQENSIPSNAWTIARERGIPLSDIRAWVEEDTVYLVTPHVRPSDVAMTIGHEVVGHKGLNAVFGERWGGLLDLVYKDHASDPAFERVCNAYRMQDDTLENRRYLTEEFLANMANAEIKPSWWREFLQQCKMGLRKIPAFRNLRVTDRELEAMFRRSARAMRKGRQGKNRDNVRFELDARKDEAAYRVMLEQRIQSGVLRIGKERFADLERFYRDFPLGRKIENKLGEAIYLLPRPGADVNEYIHHFAVKRGRDADGKVWENFSQTHLDDFLQIDDTIGHFDDRIIGATDSMRLSDGMPEVKPRVYYIRNLDKSHLVVVSVEPQTMLLTWTHMIPKSRYIQTLREQEKTYFDRYGVQNADGDKLDMSWSEYCEEKRLKPLYLATALNSENSLPQAANSPAINIIAQQDGDVKSDLKFSLEERSDREFELLVQIMQPVVGTQLRMGDAELVEYLATRNLPRHIDERTAHAAAVEAVNANKRERLELGRRKRSQWLYETEEFYRFAVDAGGENFKIKPSARYNGEEMGGTFIDRKNGIESDALAKTIAAARGGDPLDIENDLIDYFRDLKKPDLNAKYSAFKNETLLQDRALDRMAREEFAAMEEQRIGDEAARMLGKKIPVTEEFAAAEPKVASRIYQAVTGNQYRSGREVLPDGSTRKADWEAVNRAMAAGNYADYIAGWRAAREQAFTQYSEELAQLRESVMTDKKHADSLQSKAVDFAERYLDKEDRAEFIRRIVNLDKFSTLPSKKYPSGRRNAEYLRLITDMLKRRGELAKERGIVEIREMLDGVRIRRNYKGIPTSVLPSEQRTVDRIREIVNLDLAAVNNLIAANNETITALEGTDSPDGSLERAYEENALLGRYGALQYAEPHEVTRAVTELRSLIEGGKAAFREQLNARLETLQELRGRAITDATFGRNETDSHEDARGHWNYVLKNESLGTLLRIASGGAISRFESSVGGEFYRKIETATQQEATGLRTMQESFDGALRDVARVDGVFQRGKFFKMIHEEIEHTGVMRRRYTRPVERGKGNVIFEHGKRAMLRREIPVDGARELLRKIDAGIEVDFYMDIRMTNIAVEFLRQQLADFDSGLQKSYEIFGDASDDAQINRIIAEERKQKQLVVFGAVPDEEFVDMEMKLTQAAALQILLTWEQKHYRPGMEWNGWSQQSIDQIKAFLKPEVLRLGHWMRDFIAGNRAALNEACVRRYGVPLPDTELYFPGSFREGMAKNIKQEDQSFGRGAGSMNLNPGFLIARRFHLKDVDVESDAFANFFSNQIEQQHFTAWSELLRDMRGVYGNRSVQDAINNNFGRQVSANLVERINTLAAGGGSAEYGARLLGKLYRYWVPAKIAFNAGSSIKQLFGMAAYMNHMPVVDFYANLAQANFANADFRAFVAEARKSDYLKNRLGGGLDKDLLYMLNYTRDAEAYSPWAETLVRYGTKPTIWADMASSLFGGYAVYKYHRDRVLKNGGTAREAHDHAFRMWQRTTDETQQSGYLKDQNYFQANRGAWRYLTTFLTNPIQVMNLELQTINELRYGDRKAAGKKLARQILANHLIVPTLMLFTNDMLRNGFDFSEYEWEDYFVAWLLGSFEGIWLFGKLASGVANAAADKLAGRGSPFLKTSVDALPIASDAGNAINTLAKLAGDEPMSDEEFFGAMKAVGDLGMLGGVVSPGVGSIGAMVSAIGAQGKRWIKLFNQ